jgi:2-oxo-3-hexenedioate decarboxylase
VTDARALAEELTDAYANRRVITVPPSGRPGGLDLMAGYVVEAELVRMRRAGGHKTVGLKVAFPNRALWRVLKLETLAWAHMYDDTVQYAKANDATLRVGRMFSPKIEPEIVFKLKRAPSVGGQPEAVLEAVEWIALGYEIIDCVYADWKFQPADFVASFGLHAGLVVGDSTPVKPADIPSLFEQLGSFTATLAKDGQPVAHGGGKNVLQNPALCLAELAAAISPHSTAEPLSAGDVITSGALTDGQAIAGGQTWTATVSGLDLPSLSIRTTA